MKRVIKKEKSQAQTAQQFITIGESVQFYDARKSFWRSGKLLKLGHKFALVEHPCLVVVPKNGKPSHPKRFHVPLNDLRAWGEL